MSSKNQETLPRPEYPRPQFVRKNKWLNLNGEWGFAFDDVNVGLKEKWYREDLKNNFNKKIVVPFCFQSKLSGIGDSSFHDVIWYRRKFKIPEEFKENKILLHFGAVDYSCIVYLNEERVGSHEGGYIGFSFDITNYIQDNNLLVVRVEDPSQSLEIPRGKQYWGKELERIFYPRVSGIWQTVWLEFVSSTCFLKKMKFFPDIDKSELLVEFIIHGSDFLDKCMLLEVNFDSHSIIQEEISLDFLEKLNQKTSFLSERKLIPKTANCFKYILKIPKDLLHLWDVKNPNLYDLCISLSNKKSGELYDKIKSYFGMRKISISEINPSYNKQILLNNKPVFQKLFLVQGYWPEGFYTAPSDEYIKKDIQFIKDFGFNGLRTHQKAFDPRFLYWCDKLGVLVWGEIGNAFIFTLDSQLRLLNEFIAEIERDFNHPSIITWVPINESWGVQGTRRDTKRLSYTLSLFYLIKSIDPTRLVVDDDGWWHTKTDICTRHFYSDAKKLPKLFEDELKSHKRSYPKLYLKPFSYTGEPIIYSEIGGFGYDHDKKIVKKWGYGDLLKSDGELFDKILNLLKEFDNRKDWIHGFCYTELYDQFQEINGLLTIDRTPKFSPSKLKEHLDKLFY